MKTIIKLKTQSTAILAEKDQRSAIPIPARATVVVVGGDIDKDAFVKIRYEGKVLFILSEDLRNGGETGERDSGALSVLDWHPWRLLTQFGSLRGTLAWKSTVREGEAVAPFARERDGCSASARICSSARRLCASAFRP